MTDLRRVIEATPPGTMFSREGLLRAIDEAPAAPAAPENVSTVQAARTLGRSPKWWRTRCSEGVIEGAYLDDGRWYFPTRAARAYLARRSNTKKQRSARRGPNKTQSTPACGARSATGTTGPIHQLRPETMGRPALHRDP